MSEIQSRSFAVAMSHSNTIVSLSWFEKSSDGNLKFRDIWIENMTQDECEKVRKAVNALGVNWQIGCMRDDRLSILGDCDPTLATIFDMVINDDNPLQALLYELEQAEIIGGVSRDA